MPQLTIFAAAEKLIASAEDGTLSLVSLLTNVLANLPIPLDQPIPENAMLPIPWYILCLWSREQDDYGKVLEAKVSMGPVDGQPAFEVFNSLAMTHQFFHLFWRLSGFPIPQVGKFQITLYTRIPAETQDWTKAAVYSMFVTRAELHSPGPLARS